MGQTSGALKAAVPRLVVNSDRCEDLEKPKSTTCVAAHAHTNERN